MERKRLQTPHDRFFKAMFSKVPVISNFINEYLFSGVRLAFDDSIPWTIKNDSVDGFLNEFRSDIVYRLFEKTKSHFIYLLLEHKSFPDRKTVIQLKHYINSIENDITDSEKYEGPIPVVIYHGRRKWNIPLKLNLDEAGSALNRHFSILEYILVDISHTPDDRIVGSPQLRMTLMALKYVKTAYSYLCDR